MAPKKRPAAHRIWAKIDRATDPDGCWLWQGRATGYPHPRILGDDGEMVGVARWLMEQETGRPVVGRVHLTCGQGRCCRVDHMVVVPPARSAA